MKQKKKNLFKKILMCQIDINWILNLNKKSTWALEAAREAKGVGRLGTKSLDQKYASMQAMESIYLWGCFEN